MQVGVSRWPLAQAVQLSGSVQVSYLDESTLTQELLLEPFSMSASAEVSGEPEPGTASVAGVAGSMSPQASMLHARPLPQSGGISIRIWCALKSEFVELILSSERLQSVCCLMNKFGNPRHNIVDLQCGRWASHCAPQRAGNAAAAPPDGICSREH